MKEQAREDLQELLSLLPVRIRESISDQGHEDELIEIVMDLGRVPTARYVAGEAVLHNEEIHQEEIDIVVNGIGTFDDDNRAGIARTLHRISAIRNRRGKIVGLTCRVGRAVYGTIDIIADIVEEGHSILLLGRPGVGKTTMLREMARVLADRKRVVIVDTSNEIGGDGDIPHPAVGRARRMQVPRPSHQHETMIEAVENHNPEVIVIDEIGRAQEAIAARTINERGVQLIGTAHGNTLENLLLNPTLSDLVGGIESVTLSDEEARRRGTQKTVLERRSPPTFDVLIEIQDRQQLLVHRDVTVSVDSMLRANPFDVELRAVGDEDEITREVQRMLVTSSAVTGRRDGNGGRNRSRVTDAGNELGGDGNGRSRSSRTRVDGTTNGNGSYNEAAADPLEQARVTKDLNVYAYGINRNRLLQAAKRVRVNIVFVDKLNQAHVLLTLKSYYRKRRQLIHDAETRRVPVYVLRANTVTQMESFLAQALDLEEMPADPFEEAITEATQAIELVSTGTTSIDLSPTGAAIRRYQHQMARQANLVSHSYGKEPNRYVRIYNTRRNP